MRVELAQHIAVLPTKNITKERMEAEIKFAQSNMEHQTTSAGMVEFSIMLASMAVKALHRDRWASVDNSFWPEALHSLRPVKFETGSRIAYMALLDGVHRRWNLPQMGWIDETIADCLQWDGSLENLRCALIAANNVSRQQRLGLATTSVLVKCLSINDEVCLKNILDCIYDAIYDPGDITDLYIPSIPRLMDIAETHPEQTTTAASILFDMTAASNSEVVTAFLDNACPTLYPRYNVTGIKLARSIYNVIADTPTNRDRFRDEFYDPVAEAVTKLISSLDLDSKTVTEISHLIWAMIRHNWDIRPEWKAWFLANAPPELHKDK